MKKWEKCRGIKIEKRKENTQNYKREDNFSILCDYPSRKVWRVCKQQSWPLFAFQRLAERKERGQTDGNFFLGVSRALNLAYEPPIFVRLSSGSSFFRSSFIPEGNIDDLEITIEGEIFSSTLNNDILLLWRPGNNCVLFAKHSTYVNTERILF